MSVSDRFKLFLVVVVAVFLAGAPMASASVGLTASLEAQKTYIGVADDAVVRVTLQNTSSQDLYVLRWQTAVRTLVHETSHFTVVAGTQDYAYGQTACKNLAISNPTNAVNNADSHEYFAEPM